MSTKPDPLSLLANRFSRCFSFGALSYGEHWSHEPEKYHLKAHNSTLQLTLEPFLVVVVIDRSSL